jgi:streptomycin 6-kinase
MPLTNKSHLKPFAIELFKKWRLEPQGEFFSTHSSLLCRVKYNQQNAILKIVEPDDDEAQSASILKYFNGNGCVKILNDHKHAFLLEYINTANDTQSLEEMALNGKIPQATHILCDIIDKIHEEKQTPLPTNTISFTARFEDMKKHINEGRVAKDRLAQCRAALTLTSELIKTHQTKNKLLHGDIHHFNVLKDTNRGWLAIDPKGFIGPKAYEYASIFCNPYRHKDIVSSSEYTATLLDITHERSNIPKATIAQFAYIHSLQCAAWSLSPPDQDYWFACADSIKKYTHI